MSVDLIIIKNLISVSFKIFILNILNVKKNLIDLKNNNIFEKVRNKSIAHLKY